MTILTTPARWPWVIALALPLVLGCDSAIPFDPSLHPETPLAAVRADVSDAGLLVGNVSFGPTDGILRYDGTGAFIDAMVPDGTAGLTVPCCMTFGPDENLYVSSPFTSSVFRFHGVTGAFIDEFVTAGSGGLSIPLVLVFRNGKLYVGDPGTNAIRRYDAATGAFIDVFVPPGSQGMTGFDPQLFEFGTDGNLYVASEATNRVLRYNGATGAFIDEFVPVGSNGVTAPAGLTFGPDANLYVGNNHGINRYDGRTGALIDAFVTQGSGGLNTPVGITFGPDGNFYVASAGTGDVLRYDGRTGQFLNAFVPAGRGGITAPRVIEFKSKISICHRSPGNRAKGKSITIGYLSARDHVAHGDALGRCA